LGVRGGCGGWCGAPGPWAGGWGCSVASGGDAAVDVPGLGDEQAGRVDQQGGVGVLVGQLPADPVGLVPVGQVGGDPPGLAVLGQGGDSVVDLGRVLRSGPPAPRPGPAGGRSPRWPATPDGPAPRTPRSPSSGESGHQLGLPSPKQRPYSPRVSPCSRPNDPGRVGNISRARGRQCRASGLQSSRRAAKRISGQRESSPTR
jgi:hypothetical protein